MNHLETIFRLNIANSREDPSFLSSDVDGLSDHRMPYERFSSLFYLAYLRDFNKAHCTHSNVELSRGKYLVCFSPFA